MNIPSHVWCVVDRGGVTACESYEIAAAKAALWDLQFPNLAPHQIVCYALCVSRLQPTPTGSPDAIPDTKITSEAP